MSHSPVPFRGLMKGFLGSLALIAFATTASRASETLPTLQVPPGYVVEMVAAPPLVQHPLMACFDEQGRLYVTDAAGVNLDEKELQDQLPNGIRRLEDTDGDGKFDRATQFADRMTFPNGGIWRGDSLYVVSPPFIWRLRDKDGDGVAEERTKLVGEFGFIGNAADLHGCFMGPEGRLWWCDGRHGHEVRDDSGTLISKGDSARIFSSRLDGSDFRTHCGGGMDNPVEIDFTPTGDVLGTVNLFYQTRGDCLVHWLPGGRYPRDDQPDCIAEFRRTGDLLGPVHNYGHVAVSGMMRYRGDALGPAYRDGYFVCEFNTHQVNVTRVSSSGSSYSAERSDFLRSESIDFHPTDVLEDADGSLLVIDTGGWFRYGCPTSQVAKPEIDGAIYRIRRADAPRVEDPRGLKLAWDTLAAEELAALLTDGRPAVRERASETLVARGEGAIPAVVAVLSAQDQDAVSRAAWALHRIGGTARPELRKLLDAEQPRVREIAARSAGLADDRDASMMLVEHLKDNDAAVRRTAAEALGRCGGEGVTAALLEAIPAAIDRAEEHALIFAAIELGDVDALLRGLRHSSPSVQRAALMAIEQIAPGKVTRDDALALLGTGDTLAVREAMDAIAKRPSWSEALPNYWRTWLSQPRDAARTQWLRGALIAFSADPRTQAVVAEQLSAGDVSLETKQLLLGVIAASETRPLPENWLNALQAGSASTEPTEQLAFLRTCAATRDERLLDVLRKHANADDSAVRLAALVGLAELRQPLDDQGWQALRDAWIAAQEESERAAYLSATTRAALTESQLIALAKATDGAQPLELAGLIAVYRGGKSVEVGRALVEALERHPGLALVPYAEICAAFAGYPGEVTQAVEKLLASRELVSEDQQARLAAYDARPMRGDLERGRELFFGAKASCSACHRIEARGAAIGPDLTHIGAIRTRRDLGESILYPSLSLARGYDHLVSLTTKDGIAHTGLVERESSELLQLRNAQRELIRIERAEIEEQTASRVSIMPQGFDELLSDEELDDLVAYLLSLK
jgi:putative membrane-bound dehydrogenase-like protein